MEDYLDIDIIRLMDEVEDETKYTCDNDLVIDINSGQVLVNGTWYEFRKKTLFDGKLEMVLPEGLELISPKEDETQPKFIMRGENDEVQIFIEHTENTVVNDEEVFDYKEKVQRLFQSINTSIEWLGAGDRYINHTQVLFFEFVSPTVEGRVYNLTFFLRIAQRILRGFFICPYRGMNEWKQVFNRIIESMKINEQEKLVEAPVMHRDYTNYPFKNGLYGIYHGREFLMFRVGDDQYRLISNNADDCADAFYPKDGVYKKTVSRNEISAAYQLKLVLTYQGHQFDLGQKQGSQVELVMTNLDYDIARSLKMEIDENRQYVKWVPIKDIENVSIHRLAVVGFDKPENVEGNYGEEL